MRPSSGIPKKVREANLRKQRNKDRRFNEPLKIFLERKYPKVLQEFKRLFQSIEEKNPGRENLSLVNTNDFKQWMLNNPPAPCCSWIEDSRVCGQPPQRQHTQDCTLTSLQPLLEIPLLPSPQLETPQDIVQDCTLIPQLEIPLLPTPQVCTLPTEVPQDILDLACQEIMPIEEPLSMEDIPEAILNDFMNDEFLSELLNSIPEELPELRELLYDDEGIELNPNDEVFEDLQPFDFAECELF